MAGTARDRGIQMGTDGMQWACPACGRDQPATARWCGHCGGPRDGEPARDARTSPGAPQQRSPWADFVGDVATDDVPGTVGAAPHAVAPADPGVTSPPPATVPSGRATPATSSAPPTASAPGTPAAQRPADPAALGGVGSVGSDADAPAAAVDEADLRRQRRRVGVVALVVVLLAGVVATLRVPPGVPRNASPLGDPGRTGTVADRPVAPVDEVVWTAAAPSDDRDHRRGSVLVVGDTVLVSDRRTVEALDAATGELRWRRAGLRALDATRDTVVVSDFRGIALVDLATGVERYRPVDPLGETAVVPARLRRLAGDGTVTVLRTTGAGVDADVASPAPGGQLVGRDAEGRQLWRWDPATELRRDLAAVVGRRGDQLVLLVEPMESSSAVDAELELVGLDLERGLVRWQAPIGSRYVARDRAIGLTTLAGDLVVHPSVVRDTTLLPDLDELSPAGGTYDIPALPTELTVRSIDRGAVVATIPAFSGTALTPAGDDLEGPTGLELLLADGDVLAQHAAGTTMLRTTQGRPLWQREGPDPDAIAVGPDTVAVVRLNTVTTHDRDTGEVVREERLAPFSVAAPARDGEVVVLLPDRTVRRVRSDGSDRWSTRLAPVPASPLVAAADAIVTRTELATLVLDAATGERRWLVEERAGGAVVANVPEPELAFDGTHVLLPSSPRLTTRLGDPSRSAPVPAPLRALDAVTGTVAWRRDEDSRPASGPLAIEGGDAFVAVRDQVHAYDLSTGRRSFAANADALLHAVAVTPRLVVGTERLDLHDLTRDRLVLDDEGRVREPVGAIVAVDRATREPAWRREAVTCHDAVVVDDLVVTATRDGVLALDLSTGTGRWSARVPFDPCGAVVAGPDGVVVSDLGRSLAGIDPDDGTVRWTVRTDAPLATRPVVTGDELLVVETTGRFVALALDDGAFRWERDVGIVPTTPPIAVADDLVVRDAASVVRLGSAP